MCMNYLAKQGALNFNYRNIQFIKIFRIFLSVVLIDHLYWPPYIYIQYIYIWYDMPHDKRVIFFCVQHQSIQVYHMTTGGLFVRMQPRWINHMPFINYSYHRKTHPWQIPFVWKVLISYPNGSLFTPYINHIPQALQRLMKHISRPDTCAWMEWRIISSRDVIHGQIFDNIIRKIGECSSKIFSALMNFSQKQHNDTAYWKVSFIGNVQVCMFFYAHALCIHACYRVCCACLHMCINHVTNSLVCLLQHFEHSWKNRRIPGR